MNMRASTETEPIVPDATVNEAPPSDAGLAALLSPRVVEAWRVVPLARDEDGRVRLGADADIDRDRLDNLRALVGAPVRVIPMSAADFDARRTALYGLGAAAVDELPAAASAPTDAAPAADGAMVRFVNDLIRRAQEERATDIHIEPDDSGLAIRLRVDGLLRPLSVPTALARHQAILVSRIKVMAGLNIAEKRLPQDGRFRFGAGGGEIDIRVSTLPTIGGESVDLRLLPRARLLLGLEELGMDAERREAIERLIRRPNGILLVTGPTGHGKTTTLYAALSQINTSEKKIITIEDPVEVRLRGVSQIPVHAKIGLTFATGLRSILRQDPDVIMVGEIRDRDTADIAIRASLTGHLVFSTLHTNDAVGAVTRLIDMGVEPYLVASSVSAVLAQRLVRRRCDDCDGPGRRCDACGGAGFRGRTGLFEMMVLTDELRALIQSRAPLAALRAGARAAGLRSLYEDGREKARRGLTTEDEVRRVAEAV